jgi:hypothetical protein
MRQIGMILAFDLLGPLLTFSLLRSGAYLIEVAGRLVVVETTSTEIALLVSKLVPYACAVILSLWTLGYGEHEKKKAEHLPAAAEHPGTPVAADAGR